MKNKHNPYADGTIQSNKIESFSEISCDIHETSFHFNIKGSSRWIGFNKDGCKKIGILNINVPGPKNYKFNEIVDDNGNGSCLGFSPFNNDLFMSSSLAGHIKGYTLSSSDEEFNYNQCFYQKYPKSVNYFSYLQSSSNVISVCHSDGLTISDFSRNINLFEESFADGGLRHCSWNDDGSYLVASSKAKNVYIIDPRNSSNKITISINDIKDIKVENIGTSDYFMVFAKHLSLGRTCQIYDRRNPSSVVFEHSIDSLNGAIIPVFDVDTNILFIGTKGEYSLYRYQYNDKSNEVSLIKKEKLEHATLGLCSVTKEICDYYGGGEVLRLLHLSKNNITQLKYSIFKNTSDLSKQALFPRTYSKVPSMTTDEWITGMNNKPNIVQLNDNKKFNDEKNNSDTNLFNETEQIDNLEEKSKKIVELFQKGNSKYRFIEGQQLHQITNIQGLFNVNIAVSSESDGIQCNSRNLVFPLEGNCGKLTVLKVDDPGRITNYPFIENGSLMFDFSLCPCNDDIIVTSCEDNHLRIWDVNKDVLNNETLPVSTISGLTCRTTLVCFHPFSSSLLASGNINGDLILWDLNSSQSKITLDCSSFVQAISWSFDGQFISAISSDKSIRYFDPRSNYTPCHVVNTGFNSGSSRLEIMDENLVLASGFKNNGQRIISMFDYRNLQSEITELALDISPSVLQIYYDTSNGLLYCSGKGETCIKIFEVKKTEKAFYFCNNYSSNEPHLAYTFFQKNQLNVMSNEVAKCIRLLKHSTNQVSFVVPRSKTGVFHSDLFPSTFITWKEGIKSNEWFNKSTKLPDLHDFQPVGVPKSEDVIFEQKTKKYDSKKELNTKKELSEQEIVGNLLDKMASNMTRKFGNVQEEGVDENEWND